MEVPRKEKILVLVKTYPTKSKKYIETVCTAGIREDGSWVRIFPVPFRRLEDYHRFSKYQWIECYLYKTSKDTRPESYHIDESKELLLGEKIDTTNFWETRRRLILDKADIYTRISDLLIASESNKATLAIFKPVDVKFTYEKDKSDGEEDGVSERNQLAQWDLFEPNDWRIHFRGVDKIPFNFYYEVTDEDGKKFKHKIIDWEINVLFYNQNKKFGEEKALNDVVQKYGKEFLDKARIDLYLYFGTIHQFQQRNFSDPWIIIGVAPFRKR